MIIKIFTGDILEPTETTLDDSTTIANLLETPEFAPVRNRQGILQLNGCPVQYTPESTLAQLGVSEGTYLTYAIKNGGNI